KEKADDAHYFYPAAGDCGIRSLAEPLKKYVIPTFARQALSGQPITVYGSGMQKRCFTHVKDTVRALYGISRSPKTVGEVLNIGSHQEIGMMDLARRMKSMA